MCENVYLITALILAGTITGYFLQKKIMPLLQERKLVVLLGGTMAVTVMTALVIVFLRPINQFIYFQF